MTNTILADRIDGVSETDLRPENRRLLALLDEWYATPDELGLSWWDEFEKELERNRLSIGEPARPFSAQSDE